MLFWRNGHIVRFFKEKAKYTVCLKVYVICIVCINDRRPLFCVEEF